MLSKKRQLEIKMIGIPFVYCYVLYLILFALFFALRNDENVVYFMNISCEISIPFFITWWVVYNLYELLEEDGGEILYSYPINVSEYELKKNLFFMLLYNIQNWIFIVVVGCLFQHSVNCKLVLNLTMETLFFSSTAFLFMTILKDSGWTSMILFVYVCVGYFTNGKLLGLINIYLFDFESIGWNEVIVNAVKCLIATSVFYVAGYNILKRKFACRNKMNYFKFFC